MKVLIIATLFAVNIVCIFGGGGASQSYSPIIIKECDEYVLQGRRITQIFVSNCGTLRNNFSKDFEKLDKRLWSKSARDYIAAFDDHLATANEGIETFYSIAIEGLAKNFECSVEQMKDVMMSLPFIDEPFKCIVDLLIIIENAFADAFKENIQLYQEYVKKKIEAEEIIYG